MTMIRAALASLLLMAALAGCVYEPYPSYGYPAYQPGYGPSYGYGYGPGYGFGFSYYGGNGCCYGGNGYWHRHWHGWD